MSFIIRKAIQEDAEQLISHVLTIASEPDVDIPLRPEEFTMTIEQEKKFLQDIFDSENSVFFVAEVNNKIVGNIDCRGGKRKSTRHSVTLGISIQKEWRGQGIGKALMEKALEWAKETGIVKRIELFVLARNIRAIKLYEKFGFITEGIRTKSIYDKDEYIEDLLMALVFE